MDPLDSQLRFLLEADKLKTVFRQSTLIDASRKENSAEHSWHLALMALVLRDHSPPGTDLSRVIAMLMLHDLVEIDAGDLFLYAGRRPRLARRWRSALLPTGSSRCCPRPRLKRSGRCGTSSRSAARRRRSSPVRWTGSSRCSRTTRQVAEPGWPT